MLSAINNSNLPWCNEKTKHARWWTGSKCVFYCASWFMAVACLCLDVNTKHTRKNVNSVSQPFSSSLLLEKVTKKKWFVEYNTDFSINTRDRKYFRYIFKWVFLGSGLPCKFVQYILHTIYIIYTRFSTPSKKENYENANSVTPLLKPYCSAGSSL